MNKEAPEQKTVQSPGQVVARKSKASQSQRVTDIKGGYLVNGKIQGMVADLLIDCGSDLTLIDIETFNSIPESARPWLQDIVVGCSLTLSCTPKDVKCMLMTMELSSCSRILQVL